MVNKKNPFAGVDPDTEIQKHTYKIWKEMWQICTDTTHKKYVYYGARGVTVDPRWSDYNIFVSNVGYGRPKDLLELKNKNGNFEPGNTRWISFIKGVPYVGLEDLTPEEAEPLKQAFWNHVMECMVKKEKGIRAASRDIAGEEEESNPQ